MTRTRKLTLSMKEFSHLVSESLDMANATPCPQSLVDNTAVVSETSHKPHSRQPSSFQRIFSRPTNTPRTHDNSGGAEGPQTPTKMITWPFSRSPRKNRSQTRNRDNATEVKDPCDSYVAPYSVTSLAAASTSSLGSLVPADERLFQVTSRDSDSSSQNSHLSRIGDSPPIAIVPATPISDVPTVSGHYDTTNILLHAAIFGNGSTTSIDASSSCSTAEAISSASNQSRTTFDGTEGSVGKLSIGEDPTPRAAMVGAKSPAFTGVETRNDPSTSVVQSRRRPQRLSLIVPVSSAEVLSLQPAGGVAPHFPSEIECSASLFSASSPTSPVARGSSPSFPSTTELITSDTGDSPPRVFPSTLPNSRTSMIPDQVASSPNRECAPPPLGCSPRQRKRALSPRSMTPPPLPRPPPTGPLPAIPSSSVPPVPPLPPLPAKMSMTMAPNSAISSAPRSTIGGAPVNSATALPPSPPGGLRLPSRLSWVNGVRAVLPSPPASPTKSFKSLASKTSLSHTKKQSKELKRPTSIGVIEAADSAQVRRTKSILLLGSKSKSKSSTSLSPKRVQIHTDVDVDDDAPSRKPRRKSSAATVGHPRMSSGAATSPLTDAELLVLRERRHSAPMLSSRGCDFPGSASADWTLSLPFCTDVPGNKILPSPLLTPQLAPQSGVLEEVNGEDWTLCMPLKVQVDTESTVESSEGCVSEGTLDGTTETTGMSQTRTTVSQLPTPSASPTLSTPESMILPLDLDEEEIKDVPGLVERPASPASLGPHVGGLDLAGGRGKRASGWHVYGWFDEVSVTVPEEAEEEEDSIVHVLPERQHLRNHVTAFRRTHAHPSQDSMSTVSTSETTFYSARSSLLAC